MENVSVRRHSRRAGRLWSLVAILVLALAGALPGLAATPGAGAHAASAPAAPVSPATVVVLIEDFAFTPPVVTVAAGTTVRWVNRDRVQHDVFGVLNASFLRAPILSQGEAFEYTFPAPGAYDYICSIHPDMTGQVVVTGNVDGSLTFPETGFTVRGAFLRYWQTHGLEFGDYDVSYRESLALFGYPISEEFEERLEDGEIYTVQYFERARFEWHPENANTEYEVLLGQFGRRIRPADPPAGQLPGATYFSETGHNLGGRFREFWQQNGGLPVFGYPISEEFTEQLEDGQVYQVQYFERARFEWHPENPPPYDVLLGQFGRRIYAGN